MFLLQQVITEALLRFEVTFITSLCGVVAIAFKALDASVKKTKITSVENSVGAQALLDLRKEIKDGNTEIENKFSKLQATDDKILDRLEQQEIRLKKSDERYDTFVNKTWEFFQINKK